MRALKAVRQQYRNYHLKSGVFHFYRGEHKPAAEYLSRVLDDDSGVPAADRRSALYYLVQTLIGSAAECEREGNYDRAIAEYRRALQVMPSYPDVHFKLGLALRHEGRADEAVTHFRLALDSNALYVDALVELGYTLLDLGRLEEAQSSLRRAAAAQAEKQGQQLAAAEAALAAGRSREAGEIYRDAFRADLAAFEAVFKRGLELLRTETWDDAVEELTEAARLCPRFADVHNYRGIALVESGREAEAIAEFRRSVEINEAYAVAWLNLAFTAYMVGDLALAREALEPVLSREPDNGPALYLADELRGAVEARGGRARLVREDG